MNVTMSYTFLHNLLDFPAGTVPVTEVTAEDVANEPLAKSDRIKQMAASHVRRAYRLACVQALLHL